MAGQLPFIMYYRPKVPRIKNTSRGFYLEMCLKKWQNAPSTYEGRRPDPSTSPLSWYTRNWPFPEFVGREGGFDSQKKLKCVHRNSDGHLGSLRNKEGWRQIVWEARCERYV